MSVREEKRTTGNANFGLQPKSDDSNDCFETGVPQGSHFPLSSSPGPGSHSSLLGSSSFFSRASKVSRLSNSSAKRTRERHSDFFGPAAGTIERWSGPFTSATEDAGLRQSENKFLFIERLGKTKSGCGSSTSSTAAGNGQSLKLLYISAPLKKSWL